MTLYGIATVAEQEFTIRIRAGRWRWLLTAWAVVLLLFTLLGRASVNRVALGSANKGVVVYGGLTLLVLALALLVVPALAAQSVNGDRERGTLATLQVTRLTAGDIALGKFSAAWGTSLVFLAVSLPMVGYCMTQGGVPLSRVVVVTGIIALLLGTVIAMSLCLSSLLSRTTTSGVLAYLLVFALGAGTLIVFAIAAGLSQQTVTRHEPAFCPRVPVPMPSGTATPEPVPPESCQPAMTYQASVTRTDRVWWLLAPNPFVVLADAAPQLPPLTSAELREKRELEAQGRATNDLRDADPLGGIGRAVRDLRLHPDEQSGYGPFSGFVVADGQAKPAPRRPVWPYGLAFDVLLGLGSLWLTAHRLRTPSRDLPKGQRVA